ncbi:hypothetical protein EI94DRAFT_1748146 [Lactarius quietus]|nr:hypothetical protein EI94DRAFT_1748146 [Lactarius quietus]
MADHRRPSQQPDPISANTYPHTTRYQPHDQNLYVAGDDQGGVHGEGVPQVPQPTGNMVMQYPQHIDAPNYNAAHYYPPPPPPQYPEVPQAHMPVYRGVGAAEAVPAQAHPFAPEPEVQENRDGLFGHGAHFPAAGPPEAFPGVWPPPAAPVDMPDGNFLRDLVGRLLNNPDTLVNVFRIERGPRGRFEVWIALELAHIF